MRARVLLGLSATGTLLSTFLGSSEARAQAAGTVQRPLPNVMLLVDNSGSMERMGDSSLPSQNRDPATGGTLSGLVTQNRCNPGVETNPNRWGMLVQALTGSMQPFFSCGEMARTASSALANEYQIAGIKPYDVGYTLPHHRVLSGSGAANACAMGPWKLPGATGGSTGVGPSKLASSTGASADSFPADALRGVKWNDITSYYGAGSTIPDANTCSFLQATDGQIDLARDYIRFAVMTFDNDPDKGIGVNQITSPETVLSPTGATPIDNPFLGMWSYWRSSPFSYGTSYAAGYPIGCGPATPFEVGARNWAAPPWEGRLVPFAGPYAKLSDVETTNDQVQAVLTATRPFGATPIDGMLDDARDYLWNNTQAPEKIDNYVKGGCRDQYIVLLTDGAPNLNLRPNCEGGQCPYPSTSPPSTKSSTAWEIVRDLYAGTGYHSVTTFVIGFSVNGAGNTQFVGDGFPANYQSYPTNNCSAWFYGTAAGGFNGDSLAMSTYCNGTSKPPTGSTADACCQLNEIAYWGSGGTAPPFFAESQRDLSLAFARILASIAKGVSSRTIPAYSSSASSTAAGGGTDSVAASFAAAFVPNPRKVWSGELNRTREICTGGVSKPVTPISSVEGDVFADNTATQTAAKKRRFITVKGDVTSGTAIDSLRSIRPFVTTTPTDGFDKYQGTEVSGLDRALVPTTLTPDALGITDTTCTRSRDLSGGVIPALTKSDCSQVIWGFTTATPDSLTFGGYSKFNVRCASTSPGSKCAINSSTACTTDSDCSAITKGDVCVPNCSALGAIFRASPTVVGPPAALARDDGYRLFADARASRKHALFAATTDGILHAFKALDKDNATAELWSFVPPAVLPRLASNYPGGQQVLLDGSPIVKDVIWDRKASDVIATSAGQSWHTTLIAGLGTNGPGYYAMNVSDVDCSAGSCYNTYDAPTEGVLAEASFADTASGSIKRGPHFLWQLTDMPKVTGETLPVSRTSTGDNKDFVSLFGRQTATPAIATAYFDPDGTGAREIGIAILPGGQDAPPVAGGSCDRALGTTGYPLLTLPDLSDSAYPRRSKVRQWGTTCTSPVAGRSVTLVRLDTGAIIRHFARLSDTPKALQNASSGKLIIDTPFDSPMVGTPVPYPSDVDSIAKRIFIGDADGTLWRIDISSPDPSNWKALLYQDLFSGGAATDGRPVAVSPIASLDATDNIVINAATGDQENLTSTTEYNTVYSITEGKPQTSLGNNVQAKVNWYTKLLNGERVTGPMAVFDSTLYFATYTPEPLGSECGNNSHQRLYAVHYTTPKDSSDLSLGGAWMWPSATAAYQDMTTSTNGAIIPGVSIHASLACQSVTTTPTVDYFGANHYGVDKAQQGTSYSLDVNVGKPGTSTVTTISTPLVPPATQTRIDSWALITD